MKYLVDTDVVISYLKGICDIVTTLQKYEGELAISAITLGELLEGIYGQPKEEARLKGLRDFLSGVELLSVDKDVAEKFAQTRSTLRKKGNLIDNFNLLIASTALAKSLILITGNKKDFTRIEGLQIHH